MVPREVNIYEAKSQLSRLIYEVEAGAEIILARNGRPAARIVPLQQQTFDREPGSLAGKIWISSDYDEVTTA